MNVLLLSMPDYFEHMPPVAVRMPNGALTSIAGNVDSHDRVAVADLILSHRQVRETINRLFREFDPHVVGLSVMTFQRHTAAMVRRPSRPGDAVPRFSRLHTWFSPGIRRQSKIICAV